LSSICKIADKKRRNTIHLNNVLEGFGSMFEEKEKEKEKEEEKPSDQN
jgi:hypothetical protein